SKARVVGRRARLVYNGGTPNSNARPTEEGTVKYLLLSAVVVALLLGNAGVARAQTEITLLAPGPMGRETMDKLIAGFESKTGDKVKVTYGQGRRDTPP